MSSETPRTDRLRAILCDPEGTPCFSGSDGDRLEAQLALQDLDRLERDLSAAKQRITNCPHMTMPDGNNVTCGEYVAAAKSETAAAVAGKVGTELRRILKERSKGEVDSWGFVAMFLEMIDEAERAAFPDIFKEKSDG